MCVKENERSAHRTYMKITNKYDEETSSWIYLCFQFWFVGFEQPLVAQMTREISCGKWFQSLCSWKSRRQEIICRFLFSLVLLFCSPSVYCVIRWSHTNEGFTEWSQISLYIYISVWKFEYEWWEKKTLVFILEADINGERKRHRP